MMARTFFIVGTFIIGLLGLVMTNPLSDNAKAIKGIVTEIEDGDGFFVQASSGRTEEIRLFGIDAPEWKQTCRTSHRKIVNCGSDIAYALESKLKGQHVKCDGKNRDRWKRLIAICYHNKEDIGKRLVTDGHAWAFSRYSKRYVMAELKARRAKVGYWSGEWEAPWVFRKKQTRIIPGAPIEPKEAN